MGLDFVHWEFYTVTLKINHKNITFLKIGNKVLNKQHHIALISLLASSSMTNTFFHFVFIKGSNNTF